MKRVKKAKKIWAVKSTGYNLKQINLYISIQKSILNIYPRDAKWFNKMKYKPLKLGV